MPERIQLSRRAGWKMPPNTVKVDRTNRMWGNPFRVGEPHPSDGHAMELWEVLSCFEASCVACHVAIMRELGGKNLACWCKLGSPCHADILLKIANQPAI